MRSWTRLALFAFPVLAACAAVPDDLRRAPAGEESTGAAGADDSDLAPSCGALELAEAPLRLALPSTDLLEPQLVIGAGADAPIHLYAASGGPPADRVIQRATLDAWSAQPAGSIEPARALDANHEPIPGDVFAVAPLLPGRDHEDNFDSMVVYRRRDKMPYPDYLPPGFYFKTTPAWSEDRALVASPWWRHHRTTVPGDRIVTLRSNDSGTSHFMISDVREPGPRYSMMRTNMVNTINSTRMVSTIGCATTPIAFDAAWWNEQEQSASLDEYPLDRSGWLFGAALGAPTEWKPGWAPCDVRFPGVGPARTIYLGRYAVNAPVEMTSNEAIAEAATVARLRMAPLPDGAWLAWTLAPLEDAPSALRVARMTPSASVALGPITVPSCSPLVEGSLAAEQVDGDLVVAVVETSSDGSDRIVLRRLDASGEVTWMTTLYPTGKVEGSLSMVAQRGRGLLLAWAERSSSASASQLRAARFGCAEGPVALPACHVEVPVPH